jgi:hypothetical protein
VKTVVTVVSIVGDFVRVVDYHCFAVSLTLAGGGGRGSGYRRPVYKTYRLIADACGQMRSGASGVQAGALRPFERAGQGSRMTYHTPPTAPLYPAGRERASPPETSAPLIGFLRLNGRKLDTPIESKYGQFLRLAAGTHGEGELADWLREHLA